MDVLVVGAGLSGIGAAHHLQTRCPDRSCAILEARDAIGGTWDLFRCRLLNHMREHVRRGIGWFPKQGAEPPWRLHQNYVRDLLALRFGRLEDGAMEFAA